MNDTENNEYDAGEIQADRDECVADEDFGAEEIGD
jgi:hypothetical protein